MTSVWPVWNQTLLCFDFLMKGLPWYSRDILINCTNTKAVYWSNIPALAGTTCTGTVTEPDNWLSGVTHKDPVISTLNGPECPLSCTASSLDLGSASHTDILCTINTGKGLCQGIPASYYFISSFYLQSGDSLVATNNQGIISRSFLSTSDHLKSGLMKNSSLILSNNLCWYK